MRIGKRNFPMIKRKRGRGFGCFGRLFKEVRVYLIFV